MANKLIELNNPEDDGYKVTKRAKIDDNTVSPRQLMPIYLISFDSFKTFGSIPRNPECIDLCIDSTRIDYDNSLIIFISHCWLRGRDVKPHPDNEENSKYQLILAAVNKIKKGFAPRMKHAYLWTDFSCINQNSNPAAELKQLDAIVKLCDVVLTVIHDEHHDKWELITSEESNLKDYKATAWQFGDHAYLNRSWCRVEMFYSCHVPTTNDKLRIQKFIAGLNLAASKGRRPHLLYGTKEYETYRQPITLPPLQHSFLDIYHPLKGKLSVSSDRDKIVELMSELEQYIVPLAVGYVGETLNNDGVTKHGNGHEIMANGNSYKGQYVNNKKHGFGRFEWSSGRYYEGNFIADERSGFGQYFYMNGNIYSGNFANDKRNGHGKCSFLVDGYTYEGNWVNSKKDGQGINVYSNESPVNNDVINQTSKYVGSFKKDLLDGPGEYTIYSSDNQIDENIVTTFKGIFNQNIHGKCTFYDPTTKVTYTGRFDMCVSKWIEEEEEVEEENKL